MGIKDRLRRVEGEPEWCASCPVGKVETYESTRLVDADGNEVAYEADPRLLDAEPLRLCASCPYHHTPKSQWPIRVIEVVRPVRVDAQPSLRPEPEPVYEHAPEPKPAAREPVAGANDEPLPYERRRRDSRSRSAGPSYEERERFGL